MTSQMQKVDFKRVHSGSPPPGPTRLVKRCSLGG
jgi:hypothetical protein